MDTSTFNQLYGNRVRTRVCGLLVKDSDVLMVKHEPLGKLGYLWSPPGGSIEYGSTMQENLKREFQEETGLEVEVGEFMFINEYISKPLHALEIFFRIKKYDGKLIIGSDPELSKNNQIIKEVAFIPYHKIKKMDPCSVHNIFRHAKRLEDLINLQGFFKFEDY